MTRKADDPVSAYGTYSRKSGFDTEGVANEAFDKVGEEKVLESYSYKGGTWKRISRITPLSVALDDDTVKEGEKTIAVEELPPKIILEQKGMNMYQIFMLLSFGFTEFCSLACVSLHGPFYPKTADKKQASSTAAGFVFGIFQLTVFIQSLVAGSSVGKIPPKRMALAGIMLMAVSSVVFGFLDHIEGATAFITMSFIIRIIQATGNAAFTTASFAIIANEFPESVAKAISYMETAAGLGLIVGPAVGGGLYEVGGFVLPFVVMGALLFTAGCIGYFFLPDVVLPPKSAQEADGKGDQPSGMIQLLLIPTVALGAFSIFAGANGIGYLLPTLERHVHNNFPLPESFTGLIFIIDGTTYALFNPFWGWLCDKFQSPRIITLTGSILIIIGFGGIGPVPFMPWQPILWGTCVACAIFGLGLGASFVSGFVTGLTDAKARGFPDDVSTYGLVSGMWFSMMSLGCFAGASIGGILLDNVGFTNGIYYILALELIVLVWSSFFLWRYRHTKNVNISEDKALPDNSGPTPNGNAQV